MKLKYTVSVNCVLNFDIDADDEEHAQSIADEMIATDISGKSLTEISRALINATLDTDEYPDIHEN